MKLRYAILSLAMAASTAAIAHTHLERSMPADKSHVQAPTAIELHFSEAARLTSLTLQKGKGAAVAIKPLPAKMIADFSLPVTALAAGDYVVNWRAVSDDGHVVSGKFTFTVDQK
ncbi:MAG TPA: copper resistance CopC family protein [Steroidobacteraceae bacterium]|nr:copper resistance CopC family protein [Steroidobacteraceae bacterium]